jgi:hypothetical protein
MVCRETSADYARATILANSAARVMKQLLPGAGDKGSKMVILPVMRGLTARLFAML